MENIFSLYKTILYTRQFFVMKDFYSDSMGFELSFADDKAGIAEWLVGRGIIRVESSIKRELSPTIFGLNVSNWREAKTLLVSRHLNVSAVKVQEGKCSFEVKDPDLNTILIIETL
jgi:hypothetical protein